jgi:acyl-CoA synthetase (AMP-forming)/AMP-acid ligase II
LPTFPPYALFNAALGVTSILPFNKPTRPAGVNPLRIISPIQQFGVNSMFASPALLDRVARYAEVNGVRLPTLKRVISSGAPVPTRTLARFSALLDHDATILTPYGSTEAMPVSSVNSHQLLTDTYKKTDNGGGICVGKPLNGSEVVIIKITDGIIPRWTEDLRVPPGTIGEIVVKGKQVTRSYFARDHATQLAKIQDGKEVRHRMGDLGYFDAEGLLWYCGRKADRIKQGSRELFSIPCEYIFNKHPEVLRTALVEVDGKGVLCVEVEKNSGTVNLQQLHQELLDIAAQHPQTQEISTILFHPGFPVDIRHNAKIIREQLAAWAIKKSG